MFGSIAAGASAGIAANELQRHIDAHIHQDVDNETLAKTIHSKLCDLHETMEEIAHFYRKAQEPPIDIIVTLRPDPSRYVIRTQGRSYNSLFIPTLSGSPMISAEILGVGTITFTPVIGWNEINFSDGTGIFLPSGATPINVLLRSTNLPQGANII